MGKFIRLFASVIIMTFAATTASADVTVWEDGDRSFSIGGALRTTGVAELDNGKDFDVLVNNARINTSTKVNDAIDVVINFEKRDGEDVNLLDGFVNVKVIDKLQVRGGRYKVATDRSNLVSPFNQLVWNPATVTSRYPDTYDRRAEGVSAWSNLGNLGISSIDEGDLTPKFKYYGGVFTGVNNDKNPLVAIRGSIDLADVEGGYDLAGTYFGQKDIFTLGASFANQNNAFSGNNDFTAFSFDVLFERNVEKLNGTLTLGASLNDYDLDDAFYTASSDVRDGRGYMIEAGFIPSSIVLAKGTPLEGKIQPNFRFQNFKFKGAQRGNERQFDGGLNYIVSPTLVANVNYSHNKLQGDKTEDITFGIRYNF